jgi:hypothetical protein
MSLDITKLKYAQKVLKQTELVTICQCPACAEDGHDLTGRNHLIVYPDGRFGCVLNPGDPEHRSRIFALAGKFSHSGMTPAVKKRVSYPPPSSRNKIIHIPLTDGSISK